MNNLILQKKKKQELKLKAKQELMEVKKSLVQQPTHNSNLGEFSGLPEHKLDELGVGNLNYPKNFETNTKLQEDEKDSKKIAKELDEFDELYLGTDIVSAGAGVNANRETLNKKQLSQEEIKKLNTKLNGQGDRFIDNLYGGIDNHAFIRFGELQENLTEMWVTLHDDREDFNRFKLKYNKRRDIVTCSCGEEDCGHCRLFRYRFVKESEEE